MSICQRIDHQEKTYSPKTLRVFSTFDAGFLSYALEVEHEGGKRTFVVLLPLLDSFDGLLCVPLLSFYSLLWLVFLQGEELAFKRGWWSIGRPFDVEYPTLSGG